MSPEGVLTLHLPSESLSFSLEGASSTESNLLLCISRGAFNKQSISKMNWNKLLNLCQST